MPHFQLISANEFSASLTFFGIPYGDFDRTGHWSIWSISRMFEAARAVSLDSGFLNVGAISDRNASFVVMKQALKLHRKLHQMGLRNRTKLQFDLKIVQSGKTSITYLTTMADGDTGEILGENPLKMVRINKTTRRSLEIPEFYRKKLASYITSQTNISMERESLRDRISSAFHNTVIVSQSEVDINRHVNQSSYIKFCMDCATKASLSGHYTDFDRDMCLYPSLEWTITYIGESVANDVLEVFTWQDSDMTAKIYFRIELKDKPIFDAVAVFDTSADKYAYFISKY